MGMNNDTNPAVLLLSYGTHKGQDEFVREAKKRGMKIRELKLYDCTIDMDKYDEQVNWLKSICGGIGERLIDAVKDNFFIKPFIKKLETKTNYKLVDFSNKDWKADYSGLGIGAGLTPIAVEHKPFYRDNYLNKEDWDNYDNLYKFKSKGFKNKTLKEQGIVQDEDMELLDED